MSIDVTALPSELLVAPQPLIGFCGLDIVRNAVHKSIWDAFNTNRKSDRAAVQFKLLATNYEFPVAKPKRASYEWYHPKGILKRNWMLKHLHVLPAVVVLFQDLEWNDPQWTEKQVQCASAVQSLKHALHERNTRLCLVLLQKAAPLPPGEDLLASERAASLTSACGINSKMLFILPHTEHLLGYTLRLESAFLDMSQTYYTLMSKRIRTHRDQLTAAHTTLKIRHQFKLGFIAEIRQDFNTALKHYTQAYSNLDEIRFTDANCLEIKTVGGFLNYKICRLMFKLKVPRDAINQFVSHIEKYKMRVGFKDLIYEHYAWLSTQHSVFAELFCDAVKNGLPALQTQHPGIYFHKAAEYIQKRREAFLQACAVLVSPIEPTTPTSITPNNNAMALYSEFFGVRTAKAGEPNSEQQINTVIRENESTFNHSAAIIHLLGQAMAQFKIYKCPRFRKKLAIDMADEYFKSGDHANALTLYSLMLPDYRGDKWSSIFSEVLLKTLRCSLLSASVIDYITCSIEALSLKLHNDQKNRIHILENLWKVFQNVPPVSQSQISPEIRELWENALPTVKSPIHINLDKLTELFKMCATFESVELKNDEMIKVHLIVKLLTDVPLKVHCFSLILTDGTNNFKLSAIKYTTFKSLLEIRAFHCQQKEDSTTTSSTTPPIYQNWENDLKLEPDTYYQLFFTTEAQQFLENTQLRVQRIETQMGSSEKLMTVLTQKADYMRNPFRHHTRCQELDDNININSMCYIAPTFHLITQTNIGNESMLVNEYYPVSTNINNPYNVYLQNVVLNISVPQQLRNKVFLTTDISPSRQKLHSQIQIDIGELAMQASNTASYYIFSLVECVITLHQKISYTMDVVHPKVPASIAILTDGASSSATNSAESSPENVRSITQASNANSTLPIVSPVQIEAIDESRLRKTRNDTFSLKCDLEFKFTGRFYTLNKKALTKVYRGENFLFRANIDVLSKTDLDILETYFICDHNLVQSTHSFRRKRFTNLYHSGDRLEDVILLRTNAALDEWISAKEFECSKSERGAAQRNIFNRLHRSSTSKNPHTENNNKGDNSDAAGVPHHHHHHHLLNSTTQMNKNLMGKIPTNMTIISQAAPPPPPPPTTASTAITNSLLIPGGGLNATNMMSTSLTSEDGKVASGPTVTGDGIETPTLKMQSTRLVFNKAIDAIQATGHYRGFIKGVVTIEQQQQQQPIFGVYCIKWRRSGSKDENESKFIIHGMDIEKPPVNIYCTIEEKMFVKMPMTYKIVLKNSTNKVLHLTATLSISHSDNFICSGHKQLDVSILGRGEKQLVYNLYPLCVGWQNLPELTLEYNNNNSNNNSSNNAQKNDANRDDIHNSLLMELVQRAVPKKVFVLPPLKQQIK